MKKHYDFSNAVRTPYRSKARRLKPVHPGDVLVRDFMEPLGLSSRKLAKGLCVSASTISKIARRPRAVTAAMALRLAHYFGTTARLWQNLQVQYDLEVASRRIGKAILRDIRPRPKSASGTLRTA